MRALLGFSSLLSLVGGLAVPAGAVEPCALDPGPAATLFLPYFEVDLQDPRGSTTLFSVINTEAAPVLARVTLWTDLGVPTQAFHLYLTGYDVETVNLRNVFDGSLPRTAADGQDPSDTVSPKGPLSLDTPFANCDGFLPPANLTAAQLTDLRAEHRGLGSVRLGNDCAATARGDNVARGYVTIDTASSCSIKTPRDAGYFGPGGVTTSQNVLWGDFFYVNPSDNAAQGEALVRIQAFPGRFVAGESTFYGSIQGGSAIDEREPLPLSWASRFLNGAAFNGGTDLIFWQDPGMPRSPFLCHLGNPTPIPPLSMVFFDEQENPDWGFDPCHSLCPPPPPFVPFPAVANRVRVDGPTFLTGFDFGYLLIGLAGSPRRQSWAGTVMTAEGRYGVGFASNPIASGCASPACPAGLCSP